MKSFGAVFWKRAGPSSMALTLALKGDNQSKLLTILRVHLLIHLTIHLSLRLKKIQMNFSREWRRQTNVILE
jgi:hypothetical protein